MKSVIFTLGVLLVSTAVAQDLPEANAELVAELKQYCTEMATEYGTGDKDLKKYVLDCVNEELAVEGFKALTKLD